jgi:hypothetical protein
MWKGVGVFVLCLFLLMLVVKQNKTVEKFTSGKTPKDTSTAIENANSSLRDELVIGTYRENYEDMLSELEDWADYNMLKILTNFESDPAKMMPNVRNYNDLHTFKQNLASSLSFVDKT